MPVVDSRHQRSQAASSPIRNSPIMMYGSKTWAAASTIMERLDCTERKLLRRLLGYFWPIVCHNEDLYAEIDVETGRSPCSTSPEEFARFELEEATWPKTEVLD
ncbi:hypothetical protein RB195_010381 [Necator americanus]|uniref:Uncharacterized protein n=1 Tax=Necator americanus TaxID=51031 RepID=A0ABR1CXQ9_NECAM